MSRKAHMIKSTKDKNKSCQPSLKVKKVEIGIVINKKSVIKKQRLRKTLGLPQLTKRGKIII